MDDYWREERWRYVKAGFLMPECEWMYLVVKILKRNEVSLLSIAIFHCYVEPVQYNHTGCYCFCSDISWYKSQHVSVCLADTRRGGYKVFYVKVDSSTLTVPHRGEISQVMK